MIVIPIIISHPLSIIHYPFSHLNLFEEEELKRWRIASSNFDKHWGRSGVRLHGHYTSNNYPGTVTACSTCFKNVACCGGKLGPRNLRGGLLRRRFCGGLYSFMEPFPLRTQETTTRACLDTSVIRARTKQKGGNTKNIQYKIFELISKYRNHMINN